MFDRHGAVAETSADAPPTANSSKRMPMRIRRLSGLGSAWLVTGLLALNLVSCGGGGDGVGSNGTGITAGTVNGFGSVIVDGVRFDDTGATVRTDDGSATTETYVPADVKFGQRLRVSYSGVADDTTSSKGVAQTLEVDPSIVGEVTEKGANTFKVLGQTIDVIDDANSQVLPRTVFSDGYTFGALLVGDTVEVHAVRSGSGTAAIFVATRIEKLTGSPVLRLSGVVDTLVAGNTKTFFLGSQKVSYASATLLPSGASIAAGATVVVFGAPSPTDSTVLAATKIRVRQATASAASADDAYVSGIVSAYAGGSTLVVGGVSVNLASVASGDVSGTLANGVYARVRGLFDGAGVFVASKVKVRTDNSDDAELHGTVLNYTPANSTTIGSFTVRGTLVTLPNTSDLALSTYDGCGTAAANLNSGSFVEVKGVSSATGMTATRIKCEQEGSGSSVSRTGALVGSTFTGGTESNFDPTFDLQVGSVTYNVTFGRATVFVSNGRALTLQQGLDLLGSGTGFEVEGTLSGTTGLVAKKIKPE